MFPVFSQGVAVGTQLALDYEFEVIKKSLRQAKVVHQPEPSVAWCGGDPGAEAYTGCLQAA